MNAVCHRSPRRRQMIAWLVVVWVLLWGEASTTNVLAGLVLASLLVVVFPIRPSGIPGAFRPLAAARFGLYFFWKLVQASAEVSWEVVRPRSQINEGIVAVPIRGVSNTLTTLVANAISLRPGTLTLEVRRRPTVLYVHVLHLDDVEAVRREVQRLELLAVSAFGSAEALAAAEATLRDDPIEAPTASPATSDADCEQKEQR
jgi:multicomponent Na+:H+ antiporter subunit E